MQVPEAMTVVADRVEHAGKQQGAGCVQRFWLPQPEERKQANNISPDS